MANTLNIVGEDCVELRDEIEDAFGFVMTDDEAARCQTVGDLHDIVCRYTPDWEKQGGTCGSSAIFYAIRRALGPSGGGISPRTPLRELGMTARRLHRLIRRGTPFRPPPAATWLTVAGLFVGSASFFVSGVNLFAGAIGFALSVLLIVIDPYRFSKGGDTLGDLVRWMAPLNVRALRERGALVPDVWTIVAALVAYQSGRPIDKIDRDAFITRRP